MQQRSDERFQQLAGQQTRLLSTVTSLVAGLQAETHQQIESLRQQFQLARPPVVSQALPSTDTSLQSPFATLGTLSTSPLDFSYSELLASQPRMEMTQLQARTLHFDTPPRLPDLPPPSGPAPSAPVSQIQTSGQPPISSVPQLSPMPESSEPSASEPTPEFQSATQSTEPSFHIASTTCSTSGATAPATTTMPTLTVSAPLEAPGASLPTDAERAVDEAAADSDSGSPSDFLLSAAEGGTSLPDPRDPPAQ